MYLPDPRMFPRVDAKNPYIRQVMRVLTAKEQPEREQANGELQHLLQDALENDRNDELQQALAMSPSQEAYKYLWNELRDALEASPEQGTRAVVFALPVLLVAAGTRGQVQVPGRLPDVAAVTSLLAQHGVFANDREVGLSACLLSLQTLQQWTLPQVYRWSRHLQDAARGVPLDLAADDIVAGDETVHLRFLVGVAIQQAGQPSPVRLGGDASGWGMKLAEELNRQLKQDNLSLLAIPRPAQTLQQALYNGRFARYELGLQLVASRIIRKIRQANETPVAILAAHENNELRLTVSARENGERWEGYVWPLHPLDSVELIADNSVALFRECRIDDIRVQTEVQADQRDGFPLFLCAQDTPQN